MQAKSIMPVILNSFHKAVLKCRIVNNREIVLVKSHVLPVDYRTGRLSLGICQGGNWYKFGSFLDSLFSSLGERGLTFRRKI